MRLILHIGTEKTGSTAIQHHLLANRHALARRGVRLPESPRQGNQRDLVAAFMPGDFHDDFLRTRDLVDADVRDAWRTEFLEAFAAEIEAAKADADVFVVSSEHFHSRLLQPDSVAQLATFLDPLFNDISVICYLRRQDEMALSFYSEKLRAGFIPPEILPLCNIRRLQGDLPPYFDFEALLERWGEAFGRGRMAPRLYEADSLANADVVEDFFQQADLGSPETRLPEAANPSLSHAAQATLRRYNTLCGGHHVAARDRHRRNRQALVDYLRTQGGEDRGELPTRETARAFYTAFSTSNHRVATRWFARDRLFQENFSVYPEESGVTDWESVASLLAGFLAEQGDRAATARAETQAESGAGVDSGPEKGPVLAAAAPETFPKC
ncbi:MAG: hypothetical protein RIC38_15655 [Chromatocurvus sp.]